MPQDFVPKPEWHHDGCITFGCRNPSTLEAVYGTVRVLCCDTPACKANALKQAVITSEVMETLAHPLPDKTPHPRTRLHFLLEDD